MINFGVYKVGLGLWNFPIASYAVEALLLIVGLWIYLKSTTGKDISGKYGMLILTMVLLLLNGINTFVLYPTSVEIWAVTMLTVYPATIFLAFWLDRREICLYHKR